MSTIKEDLFYKISDEKYYHLVDKCNEKIKEIGIKKAELARNIKYSRQLVNNVLNKKSKSNPCLIEICKYLGVIGGEQLDYKELYEDLRSKYEIDIDYFKKLYEKCEAEKEDYKQKFFDLNNSLKASRSIVDEPSKSKKDKGAA